MTTLGNENLCTDEETSKKRAHAIKSRMKTLGHEFPLTHAYEALASSCGYRDWPTMRARLRAAPPAQSAEEDARPTITPRDGQRLLDAIVEDCMRTGARTIRIASEGPTYTVKFVGLSGDLAERVVHVGGDIEFKELSDHLTSAAGLNGTAPGTEDGFTEDGSIECAYEGRLVMARVSLTVASRGSVFSIRLLDPPDAKARPGKGERKFTDEAGLEIPYGTLFDFAYGGELIFGPPGKGKSVLIQNLLMARIASHLDRPEPDRFPEIAVVDIGPSSKSFIDKVKARLPPEYRHYAAYRTLAMKRSDTINPFDTSLGLRSPGEKHRAFLRNFLCAMCFEPASDERISDAGGPVDLLVGRLYSEFDDGGRPKTYRYGADMEVDREIRRLNLRIEEGVTTWWSVTDALSGLMRFRHAGLAQRNAVPTLSDLLSLLSDERHRLSIPMHVHYAAVVREALAKLLKGYMPMFGGRTEFDVGDAKVVVIDIDHVSPKGGGEADRQTALAYMLARHALCRDFYRERKDYALAHSVYMDHYEATRRDDAVRFVMFDEAHRVAGSRHAVKQIAADVASADLHRLRVGISTQSLRMFDGPLLDQATNVFVMGISRQDREILDGRLGFDGTSLDDAERQLIGPSGGQTPMLALKRTPSLSARRAEPRWQSRLVYNVMNRAAMWEQSMAFGDEALRDRLSAIVGGRKAIELLVARFPGGTAMREIEKRMAAEDGRGLPFDRLLEIVTERLAGEIAGQSAD